MRLPDESTPKPSNKVEVNVPVAPIESQKEAQTPKNEPVKAKAPVETPAETPVEAPVEASVEAKVEKVAETADVDVVEQTSPDPENKVPSQRIKVAKNKDGSSRRGNSDEAVKPDVEFPGSNPEDPRANLQPYVGTRQGQGNELGLVITNADNCFHLNKGWRGGVCVAMGNKPCPFLGGQQPTCDKYTTQKPARA